MGFKPTRAEHNGLAVHRLNHSATSSHRGCAIEPDGNTATHREREGKELDTGDVVPKMASYARLRKTRHAFEGPSRRGWDSNPRVQSRMVHVLLGFKACADVAVLNLENPEKFCCFRRGDPIGKVCEKSALQNA